MYTFFHNSLFKIFIHFSLQNVDTPILILILPLHYPYNCLHSHIIIETFMAIIVPLKAHQLILSCSHMFHFHISDPSSWLHILKINYSTPCHKVTQQQCPMVDAGSLDKRHSTIWNIYTNIKGTSMLCLSSFTILQNDKNSF